MNNTIELKTQKIEFTGMIRQLGLDIMEHFAETKPKEFDAFLSVVKKGGDRVKLFPESIGMIAMWMHDGAEFTDCLNRIENNFQKMGI